MSEFNVIRETVPGVAGNCTTGVAFGLAWMTANTLPLLHILSVLVGILASVATAGYYFYEWRADRQHRAKYGRLPPRRRKKKR